MSEAFATATAPAGWYQVDDGRLLWWDGAQWTNHVHPSQEPLPVPPEGKGADWLARAAFGVFGVLYLGSALYAWLKLERLAVLQMVLGGVFMYFAFAPIEKVREQLQFRGRPIHPLVLIAVPVTLTLLAIVAAQSN